MFLLHQTETIGAMNALSSADPTALFTSDQIEVESLGARRRMLRLAAVTETWPPEVNGVAYTLNRLLQATIEHGHEVQLVRLRRPATDPAAKNGAVAEGGFHETVLRSLPIPRYPGLRMGVPSKGALLKLWMQQRPDLVHIATEGPLGWSALRAAIQLRIPVTSDFRTNFHRYSGHYGLGLFRKPIAGYLRKFHNRTMRTMVPTAQLAEELSASGYRNLTVIGRGVDTSLFCPSRRSEALRQSWGVGPNDLVVVNVGRLAAEKNLDLLIRAHEAIVAQNPQARLVLVGDGPLRAALKQRCPQAIFAGQRKGEDLAAHYASADLFLFPSLTETFGNVVTEAMASGLAVVSYDCAAAHEHIDHGLSGLLAESGQETRFIAQAALAAIDMPLRERLARGALEKAQSLSWDSIAAQFERELFEVLRQG